MAIQSNSTAAMTLTPNAIQKVKSLIETDPENAGKSLRLFVEGSCCSKEYGLQFDVKQPGDCEYHLEGVSVVVDSDSNTALQGCVVDYIQEDPGAGFTIAMPSQASSCGCCS
jgi:iron-sulfur cluster assembly accessory protein